MEAVSCFLHRRQLKREKHMSPAERTALSGVDRLRLIRRLAFLSQPALLLPFCWMQRLFVETDLGTGFILLARRDS